MPFGGANPPITPPVSRVGMKGGGRGVNDDIFVGGNWFRPGNCLVLDELGVCGKIEGFHGGNLEQCCFLESCF